MRISKLLQKASDDALLKPRAKGRAPRVLIATEDAPPGYVGTELDAKDVMRGAKRRKKRR